MQTDSSELTYRDLLQWVEPRLASRSTWLFRCLRIWKKEICRNWAREDLIFLRMESNWICLGFDLKFNACMSNLEAPKTIRDRMFLLIASVSPCHKARASALLLVSIPSPHWYRNSIDPSGFSRTPPPPAAPGLPLEAPSKKRQWSSRAERHLINSCSSRRIS